MHQELLQLVPEFNLIQDVDLRDKTVQVWEQALQLGGWQLADLATMPFSGYIPGCPVTVLEHVRAVTRSCIAVAQVFAEFYGDRQPVNVDVLISGALLHDVGKLLEYRNVDGQMVKSEQARLLIHPETGMALAAACGLPAQVQHMIVYHARTSEIVKHTAEAAILYHVDFAHYESIRDRYSGK